MDRAHRHDLATIVFAIVGHRSLMSAAAVPALNHCYFQRSLTMMSIVVELTGLFVASQRTITAQLFGCEESFLRQMRPEVDRAQLPANGRNVGHQLL